MSQTNPSSNLVLSPFDIAMGPVYIRKLFGFGFDDATRRTEACEALRQALSATMIQYPFAAASIELVAGKAPVALAHPDPSTALCPPLFAIQEITNADFPFTYEQLSTQGAPPSLLPKELFSSLPGRPEAGEVCPALGLQVNFLPDGGLILCLAFHHTVFDGAGMTGFLGALGANITAGRPPADCVAEAVALERLPRRETTGPPPELSEFPEYDFSNARMPKASSASTTSRILTFKADKLAALRNEVAGLLQGTAHPGDFVSTADCLGGLIWVAVLRARAARLAPCATTKWAVAVNARRRLDPPLPASYAGNAVVHGLATAQVGQLLAAAHEPEINVVRVTCAASRIRQAVDAVDDAYVRKRLALFGSVPDPAEIPIASKRALDMPNTGLDFSDWREQGADIEFGIPGACSSKPDWVRKTWSANEGAVNFLPRRGGRKGSAGWEVLLALSVEDMEKVCSELAVGGWVSRVVE